MARFTFFDALGLYGTIGNIVDENALTPVEATPVTTTLLDPQGDGFSFFGSGLTYSSGGITGGTITGISVFTSTNLSLVRVENLSVDAASLWSAFSLGGVLAASDLLTAGRDSFFGSGVGDLIESGRGNDRIFGGGGADLIHGGRGDDLLTGGTGADRFIFIAGDGTDTIKDFHDAGLASDDQIAISARMFRTMVVTETLTGVDLDFGAKGMLTITGWHAADVDRGDFLFA